MTKPHPADKVKGRLSVGHHKVVIETIVSSTRAFGQNVPKSEIIRMILNHFHFS